jgi:tetratricopeptide (TPR) repeat protein
MNLPTLLVYAASDVSWFGPELPGLARRIVERGAPWTVQFASGQPHGFDALSDTDDSRRIIQQTIAFWKSHLEPLPQPSWPPSEARAVEAAIFANDPRQSVPLLERWTAHHTDDAGALAMLGRGLGQLNRFPESERAYQRALALDSTNPGVLNGLAQFRLNQSRWEEAIELLERARQHGMENSLVVGQIGWAQLNLQRNAEAAASYERAFQLGIPPGRNTAGVAWYNLACAYVRLGQLDLAFRALDRAVIEGFRDRATYEGDDDLRPLREDPRFSALRTRLEGPQGTSPP